MISNFTFSQSRLNTLAHGYVTSEAMNLLLNSLNGQHYLNSDLCQHFNNPICGENGYSPFEKGTIKAGSFIEDNAEIVYHWGDYCDYGASSTHFWDADYGDASTWEINCSMFNYTCTYKNAYQKALSYWNGNRDNNADYWLQLGPPVFNWVYNNNGSPRYIYLKVAFSYEVGKCISDVYKDPTNLIVKEAWFYDPIPSQPPARINIPNCFNIPIIQFLEQNTIPGTLNSTILRRQIKNICWEIVGRVAHLYEDMGTPAHAHNDAHGGYNFWIPECLGGDDGYELNYLPNHFQEVNWQNAMNAGGYINLNTLYTPLRASMYVMNQIGDRFPSNDANGDNSIHENPGSRRDSAFVYQQIVPVYQYLYNEGVGYSKSDYLSRPNFYNDHILYTSYVYSIRMVAGFLDFVFNQFGLDTLTSQYVPQIDRLVQSRILTKNSSSTITCHLSQGYAHTYNYTVISSDPSITWDYPTENNNVLTLHRANIKSEKREIITPRVKVTCQALGNYGNSERDTIEILLSDYSQNTCPWVYIFNENKGWVADNNILNKSKLPENVGREVIDKYILRETPSVINNSIKLNLCEIGTDSTIINNIKLYAIDHNMGTNLGVTEAGDLVLYDSTQVASTTYAMMTGNTKGRGEEITKHIQYDYYDSTNVLGDSTSSISADYAGTVNTGLGIIIGAQIDGKLNPSWYCNADAPLFTGTASVTSDATVISSDFKSRWEFSNIIIPVSNSFSDIKPMNLNIDWNVPYRMQYAALTKLNYNPDYYKTECLIINASKDNLNIVPYIYNLDSLSSYISPTSNIELTFAVSTTEIQKSYTKRDYLLELNGQIISVGGNMNTKKVQPKQIQTIESSKESHVLDNYPNPFNPSTKISYILSNPGLVSIEVFDVLGRVVRTLVNEFKYQGSYTIEFDASSLSSGIYFYRFKTGNTNTVKKMMLIK